MTLLGRDADDAETPSTQGIGGFVEEPRFYPYLTARRNLELMADLDGGGQERIDEVLENVRLGDRADRKVGGFSSGMRQRLGLAASLLRKPTSPPARRADRRARSRPAHATCWRSCRRSRPTG